MSRIHFEKRRDFLKGACGLVAAGGASTFVPQLSMMGTALAQSTFNNYRALVCVYLDGGNDSWNMLIPATPARHNEYVAARGGLYAGSAASLAVPISGSITGNLPNAIALSGSGGATNPNAFALNPFVSSTPTAASAASGRGIHRVYNRSDSPRQRLAFLANIGPLLEPIRKNSPSRLRPPQLYSHNDQQNLWLIGGGSNSNDQNGWGGRLAGALLGGAPLDTLSPCISVAGQTRFLVGTYPNNAPVVPYRISTGGQAAVTLNNYAANSTVSAGAARRAAMLALMNATYPQAFSNEYGEIVDRSLDRAQEINDALIALAGNATLAAFNTAVNNIPTEGPGNQLRQVARMIAVSRFGQGTIQANRQIFFVRTGGYDTHDGQIQSATGILGHHRLLRDVSVALEAFDTAIRVLDEIPGAGYSGVYNEVLTMTNSEFARTVNSNGNGTDHAWGGVQILMGGAVVGNGGQGQVVGPYPRQVLGLTQNDASPLPAHEVGECFNRGEFLPRIAVDQLGATIASWMGIAPSGIDLLFPHVQNFANAPVGSPIAFRSATIPNLLAGVS